MSFLLDLDEIPEERLVAELERRKQLRSEGKCDYCERDVNTSSCKFPHRHKAQEPEEVRWTPGVPSSGS